MRKVSRSWVAVAGAALLLGTLVGVVWARPHERPQAQDITRKITIPAAFFSPIMDGFDYLNTGRKIETTPGSGAFFAPVVFPCLPSVTVERFILYVNDYNASGHVCAELHRSRFPQGDEVMMASVCSNGTSTGVQPLIDDDISPNVVWPAHGVYVLINISGEKVAVHGVRIEYHRNL